MRFFTEGAELRRDLIAAGLLWPRGEPRPEAWDGPPVLRLDGAGRAAAARHIAQWWAYADRYPDRLPRFRSGMPDLGE